MTILLDVKDVATIGELVFNHRVEASRPRDHQSLRVVYNRSSLHHDMLQFEETLGAKDVFETSYIVVSIWLLCLVKICFSIRDFSATYKGGATNR